MTMLVDQTVDYEAMIAKLQAENAQLRANQPRVKNGLKVSEKGALSLYGYGRFPITLYKETMLSILGRADEIKAFIAEHDGELKVKE